MIRRSPLYTTFISKRNGYIIAVGAVAVMIALRYVLSPIVPVTRAPFLTLYLAVLAAAVYGGTGPAILATVLTTIYGVTIFVELPNTRSDPSSWVTVLIYVLTAFGMALFSIVEQRSQEQALDSANAALDAERKLRVAEQEKREQAEQLIEVEKLQRDTQAQLESLLANAPVGIAFFDRELRYVRINDYLADLKGISVEDHIGRTVYDVMPQLGEQLGPVLQEMFEVGSGVTTVEVHAPSRGSSNRTRSWLVGIYPVQDENGKTLWAGAVGVEISRQKEVEREIRKLNQSLEDKVSERTQELSAANEELHGFTYSVSHDLRAPLRSIIASSRFLLEDYGDKLDAEGKDLLRKQSEAAKRLAGLIDDMLKYARLSRADLSSNPVNLGKLLVEIAHNTGLLYDHEAKIAVSGETIVAGDSTMLRLVMENFVDNAFKYRDKDRQLQISLQGIRRDSLVDFRLTDNGIGFDPEYSSKLFQPFERLHRKDEYPGSGIGLANVKRVVERHGGTVSAAGAKGEGAEFSFSLPAAKDAEDDE